MKYTKEKKNNRGFSLVELIIVIALMAILVGIITPQYLSYMHKSRVAADWANLKNYFTEIQADFAATGEYNYDVPIDYNDLDHYNQREIHFLSGQTVKMKDGFFSVAIAGSENGYQIEYYCNECLKDWDKHSVTCILSLK